MPTPGLFPSIPEPLARIDIVGESIGALISLLLTYYAYKAYKFSNARSLFLLLSGFLLIGLGLLVHVVLLIALSLLPTTIIPTPSGGASVGFILLLGNLLHWVVEGLGYTLLLTAYVSETRVKPTPISVSLQFSPIVAAELTFTAIFESFALVLLIATVVQVVLIYLESRWRNTLFVLGGFLLLVAAHLTFIFFPLTGYATIVYVLGHAFQLSGFLFLLVALTRQTLRT